LWALAVLLGASPALAGCSPARGCLEGCGSGGDAGQSGQPHGPGTLDTCPMMRACPHVQTVSSVSTESLGSANAGTAHLGNAIETPIGPAVSWVMSPDVTGGKRRIGVAFPEQTQVVAFDAEGSATDPLLAPMVFQRDNEVDLVPPPAFDHVIPIPLDTMQAGTSIPITLGSPSLSVPALAGIGQALAAVVDPGPELRFYGAALGDPLLRTGLGNDTAAHALALTPTCNGIVASWGSKAAAFTPLGDRSAPTVDTGLNVSAGQLQSVAWDGGELVISGGGGVVELDSKGKVLSRTTTSMGAAVGTDDGLLTIEGGLAVVRGRKTGGIVKSYSAGSGAIHPGAVVVSNRYVYFIQASTSALLWVRVGCSA